NSWSPSTRPHVTSDSAASAAARVVNRQRRPNAMNRAPPLPAIFRSTAAEPSVVNASPVEPPHVAPPDVDAPEGDPPELDSVPVESPQVDSARVGRSA